MGLQKEVWLEALQGANDQLFDSDLFLSDGVDYDMFVENGYVNFAHKGDLPIISKNPTYPLSVATRTDTPDRVAVSPYASPLMRLPQVDLFALPYDKRTSLMADYSAAMLDRFVSEGVWATSPYQNTPETPIVDSTGAAGADGLKLIVTADIAALRKKLDAQYPALAGKQWVLMLDTESFWALVSSDEVLKLQQGNQTAKGAGNFGSGGLMYYNFEIRVEGRQPLYSTGATPTRQPYGTAFASGTNCKSATAYVKNLSFCRARTAPEIFEESKTAAFQADLVSFLMHGYIGPFSENLQSNLKYLGAIRRVV